MVPNRYKKLYLKLEISFIISREFSPADETLLYIGKYQQLDDPYLPEPASEF